jgi:hypothetical protein
VRKFSASAKMYLTHNTKKEAKRIKEELELADVIFEITDHGEVMVFISDDGVSYNGVIIRVDSTMSRILEVVKNAKALNSWDDSYTLHPKALFVKNTMQFAYGYMKEYIYGVSKNLLQFDDGRGNRVDIPLSDLKKYSIKWGEIGDFNIVLFFPDKFVTLKPKSVSVDIQR